MPLVVLPARVPDVESVYDMYFEAFKDEPITEFLYPRGVDRKAHTEGTKQWWSHDTIGYTIKCLDTDTGSIVGMATWDLFLWNGKNNGWERPEGIPWLEGKERERCDGVFNNMWDMREKLFGNRHPYIHLNVIAVHPDQQRRGIGRKLVQWGIDIADQLQLPIYTESSKPGLRLYETTGFETLTHVSLVHKEEITGQPDAEVPLVVKLPSIAKGLSFKEWIDAGYPADYRIHANGNGKVEEKVNGNVNGLQQGGVEV